MFTFLIPAAVSCVGASGFLRVQQQVYLIEPLGQTADEEHAVYRWEHLKTPGQPGAGFSSNASMLFDRDQNQEPNPQPEGLFRSRSWVRLLLPEIGNVATGLRAAGLIYL